MTEYKKIVRGLFIFLCTAFSFYSFAQADLPCDKDATKETKALYSNLKKLAQKGFMFGHQDALAYGVTWKYEKSRSDVKDVTGDYPAVYGWDLGGIERDNSTVNLDGVPFNKMKQFMSKSQTKRLLKNLCI